MSLTRTQQHRKELIESMLGSIIEYATPGEIVSLLKDLDASDPSEAYVLIGSFIEIGLPGSIGAEAYSKWCKRHGRGVC